MASTSTSIVALGVYRDVATNTAPLFENRPWTLAAVLDLQDARHGYTAHNLGVTLRALSPRPRGFIVGLGISEEMSAEAMGVWKEYVSECGVEGGYVWKLKTRDWPREIVDTLTEKFGG